MGIFRGSTLSGDALANIDIVADNIDNVNTVGTNIASVNAVAGDIGDVTTVAGIAADVGVVASISTEITSVDANETNITTVAGIDSDVTTVAGISSNVTTVAGMSANISSIIANETNINTVAADIADVATVAEDIADVSAVAAIDSDVTTVAGIDSEVATVAGIAPAVSNVSSISTAVSNVSSNATNINTVAGISSNVTTVAGIAANVTTVAGISASVTSVAGNATNINTVAGISGNVTTVATNNANVTTVATNIASVNTNATNIANINQNAANITAIQNASANATAAANSATAAAGSATSAAASAAAASAVALGNEPVRHSVRPSLLLDFANTKTLDPRITFTRGSTGTFYDGKTVAKAEENLVLYSQEFDNTTGWTLAGSLGLTRSANTSTAPDGTTTADTITEDSALNGHFLASATVATSGQVTLSVFAKLGSGSRYLTIGVSADGTNHASATFDLSSGSNTQTQANGAYSSASATITAVAQSFYRCTLTVTTTTVALVRIGMNNTSTPTTAQRGFGATYTGDGTSSLILWGAQLEQRSSVTAYTATTTAPITNYIPALQTAASGVARFEHNPVTGESLGLEIEEQRTNLILQSQFASGYTLVRSTLSTNVSIAPDGTLTASKLIPTSTSGTHALYRAVTVTSGASHTWSVYAKAGEYNTIHINCQASSSIYIVKFDLSAGTSTNVSGTGTATITSVGNGWYRCTATATTASTSAFWQIDVYDNSGNTSFAGNDWNGVYIWGAQLEAGAFATSYIPTTSATVTRSADSASMTGTNFSSWYRADEGSVYSEASFITASAGNRNIWTLGFTSTSFDATFLTAPYSATSRYRLLGYVGSTLNVDLYPATTYSDNTINKTGFAYKVNDFALSINASSPTTDTSGSMSALIDRLFIGSSTVNTQNINGTIKKLAYYPKRLTNEELQGLTTV